MPKAIRLETLEWEVQVNRRPMKWRQVTKKYWDDDLTVMTNPQYWEEDYISDHTALMDARVLARMLSSWKFPQVEESPRLLADELSNFDALVAHRSILMGPETVELLARQLRSAYGAATNGRSSQDLATIKRQSSALARLLTEAEESDLHTLIPFRNVPLHFEINRYQGDNSSVASALTTSGLCIADSALAHEDDISVFADLLRLQLLISSDLWYWREIRGSVVEFHRRLEDRQALAGLADDALVTLVNTTIYIGMFLPKPLVDSEFLNSFQADHTARTLDVLAAIASNRPDMSMSVSRQICWGIWMCSKPHLFVLSGDALVPLLKTATSLSAPLAAYLTPESHPSLLHAILVVMDGLLSHTPAVGTVDRAEERDHEQLLLALLSSYPSFVAKLAAQLREPSHEHSSTLRLVRRLVGLSVKMAFYHTDAQFPWAIEADQLAHDTSELLLTVYQQLDRIPPSDRNAAYRLAIGSICHIAMLQVGGKTGFTLGPVGDAFDFEGVAAETLAENVVSVLHSAAQLPPHTLEVLLEMIALLPRQMKSDADSFESQVLAHLRGSPSQVEKLILSLEKDMHEKSAKDALRAVQILSGELATTSTLNTATMLREPKSM